MKPSKFSDEQIIAILKEVELGAKVLNMIVAGVAALAFVGIARRCRREEGALL